MRTGDVDVLLVPLQFAHVAFAAPGLAPRVFEEFVEDEDPFVARVPQILFHLGQNLLRFFFYDAVLFVLGAGISTSAFLFEVEKSAHFSLTVTQTRNYYYFSHCDE